MLVATPLLHGLRKAFPKAKISIGVGDWAKSLLENNPDLDEVISCNAPWHNKQNCRFPANSPRTFLEGLLYVLFSKESRILTRKNFTHGIDVLGSRQGSWLMRRMGIPNRFGVKGYAGGDEWCCKCVEFTESRNIAESALEVLKLLDANIKIESRPRIILSKSEKIDAEKKWGTKNSKQKRIVIAPGGGFQEKCWGDKNFTNLTNLIQKEKNIRILILGTEEDAARIQVRNDEKIENFCGKLSLRESAAIVAKSDFVITNTSLCMHLAGSFKIPSITLLGEWYDNASLHAKQWGYPEGVVLGKGDSRKSSQICSANEAYHTMQNIFNK